MTDSLVYPPTSQQHSSLRPTEPSLRAPAHSRGQLRGPSPAASSASSHHSTVDVRDEPKPTSLVTTYLVQTETDSFQDLRLQVIETAQLSRSARPVLFRERSLTAQDEIVDQLVDATTGKTAWTIHRPTRGWYLHVKSPNLPSGFAIPLRPARPEFVTSTTGVQDPTSTPLTFSLGTRLKLDALAQCKTWIKNILDDEADGSVSLQSSGEDSGGFLAVDLNVQQRSSPGSSSQALAAPLSEPGDSIHRSHNARTSSISSVAQLGDTGTQSHARRRSAGRTPMASPDVRMNLSSRFEGVKEVSEDAAEENASGGIAKSLAKQTSPKIRGVTSPNQAIAARPRIASSRQPVQCSFLLLDGAARLPPPPAATSPMSSLAPGRIAEGSQRLGWAKWAWSLVPAPIRPPLSFDTSKSFSVRWIEAPLSQVSAQSQVGAGSRSVEVVRYEDEGSKWAIFGGRTQGTFLFQEAAVKALGIDRAFWMAVSDLTSPSGRGSTSELTLHVNFVFPRRWV